MVIDYIRVPGFLDHHVEDDSFDEITVVAVVIDVDFERDLH